MINATQPLSDSRRLGGQAKTARTATNPTAEQLWNSNRNFLTKQPVKDSRRLAMKSIAAAQSMLRIQNIHQLSNLLTPFELHKPKRRSNCPPGLNNIDPRGPAHASLVVAGFTHLAQFLLQIPYLIAQPGGQFKVEISGGTMHLCR